MWKRIVQLMTQAEVRFDAGLTDAEVARAEARFDFRFPADLRAFLLTALPRGEQFPDWRALDDAKLNFYFDTPRSGIVFDIEHNNFWLPEWGPKPKKMADRVRAAEKLIAAAPKLVPIFAHRMMPSEPLDAGNPVFSVHQTDIIYYGYDLEDYLRHEFELGGQKEWPEKIRPIRFWDLNRFQTRWDMNS